MAYVYKIQLMKKHALLVTYGGGHCMMMIPLFQYLKEQGVCDLTILGLTTAGKVLDAHNIPYLSYKDFIRPGDEQALSWGKELASSAHTEHSGMSLEESIAYLGISFADLVREHGFSIAWRMYQEKGRYIFHPFGFLQRVIHQFKPSVVVTTNSPRSERAALEVAMAYGIPTVAMIDLFGKTTTHRLRSQHVCVLNKEVISNMEANGCKGDHYHITGNPAMDAAFQYKGPIDYEWRKKHFPSLDNATQALLFDTQPYVKASTKDFYIKPKEEVYRELDYLAKVCADLKIALFLRPHPNQAPDLFKEWLARQDICQAFWAGSESYNLYPVLNICDVIVSHSSTILLEALYMERAVIQLDYPDSLYNYRYDQAGFAWFANLNDSQNFRHCLFEALTNTQKRQAIQHSFKQQYSNEPAAPKIGELIKKLMLKDCPIY